MARTSRASSPATGSIPAAPDPASHRARISACTRCSTARVRGASATSSRRWTMSLRTRTPARNIESSTFLIAAGVYESYNTDPLTLAAREVVRCGDRRRRRGRQLRPQSGRSIPVWQRHSAWECAVGADRRCLQPYGHDRSRRRHDAGVQLARSNCRSTTARSRTSSRPASASNHSAI